MPEEAIDPVAIEACRQSLIGQEHIRRMCLALNKNKALILNIKHDDDDGIVIGHEDNCAFRRGQKCQCDPVILIRVHGISYSVDADGNLVKVRES
jgi:hypothetical protein